MNRKLKAVIMTLLCSSVVLAQAMPDRISAGLRSNKLRQNSSIRVNRTSRIGVAPYAFFEAFPSTGAGTNGVCSTTAPTGVKGEVLTFSRASNATCTKTASGGLATTGIADGDLVVMSSNQPRVMYDSAGTLGLLVEATRTNSTLMSQEIDNVSWTSVNSVVGNPTVTANFAVAPDGTTTAERLEIPATSGTQFSLRRQVNGCPASTVTPSFYIKGNGSSGTVAITDPAGGASCQLCTYVAGSWSRCSYANRTGTTIYIGNDSADCAGNPAFGAADVFIWGAQCEAGAYATSYIPTTTIAVARAAEAATLPVIINTTNGFSHAHSFTLEGTAYVITGGMGLYQDALNRTQLFQYSSNAFSADIFTTSGNRSAGSVPGVFNPVTTTYRLAAEATPAGVSSGMKSYLNGVLTNTGTTGLTSAWTSSVIGFSINAPWGSGHDAIYTRICVDSDPSRCR